MTTFMLVQYIPLHLVNAITPQGWREAVASSKAAASKLGLVASAQLLQNRCSLPPIALTSDLATWHHAQKLAAFASWVDYVQVSHVADI
jgi:hypothetical protein